MSSVIPKEQLAAYQRWQANSFDPSPLPEDAPPPETVIDESEDPIQGELVNGPLSLPTAEDIEQIHEQARNEGFQAGFEEGKQAAEATTAAAREQEIARLIALTANFRDALSSIDQVVAEQTLDLALEVASLVIGSALQTRRELLLPIIREALQALPLHHGNISVHVSPEDIESLRENVSEIFSQGTIHLIPDNTISPGGCLLTAGHSEVDASLETRWKRVLEAIGVDPEKWLIR
jgi:flagellar assembly protein FliH